MARIIHRCGELYREWDGFCDRYTAAPMTRAAMAEYLARTPPDSPETIEARLVRADAQGTSAWHNTRETTCWDLERCGFCEGFHHAFDPLPEGGCRGCNDPQDDPVHGAPCTAPRRGRGRST